MTDQVHQAIREPLSLYASPGSAGQGCNEERGQVSQDSAFAPLGTETRVPRP